jgi:large subunit ribosomal protein L28e
MSTVSQELVWSIVKNNHCKLLKRRGQGGSQFTTERNNLKNVNAYKYTGFRAQSVSVHVDNKGALIVRRARPSQKNPSKRNSAVTVGKGYNRRVGAIAGATKGSFYRGDLTTAALQKHSRLYRAAKPSRKGDKKTTDAIKSSK